MQQTFCSSVLAVPHTWVQWTGSNHRCRTADCSSQTCLAVQGALPFSLFPEASSCAPCPEWTGGGEKGSCSLHLCGSFVDFPLPTCQAGTVLISKFAALSWRADNKANTGDIFQSSLERKVSMCITHFFFFFWLIPFYLLPFETNKQKINKN